MTNNRAATNAIVSIMADGAIRASRRNGDATTLLSIAMDGIPELTEMDKQNGFRMVTDDRVTNSLIAKTIEQKIEHDGLLHNIDAAVISQLENAFDVAARRLANDDRPLPENDDTRINLQKAAQKTADAIASTRNNQ